MFEDFNPVTFASSLLSLPQAINDLITYTPQLFDLPPLDIPLLPTISDILPF